MKKTIMLTALLAISGITGFSKKNELIPTEVEKKITVASFNQLTIDGHFKVNLIESEEPAILLKGSAEFLSSFTFHQHNNNLVIGSSTGKEFEMNQVIIHVKNLKSLIVLQNATVDARAILVSKDLEVMLNAESLIQIDKSAFDRIKISDDLYMEVHEIK